MADILEQPPFDPPVLKFVTPEGARQERTARTPDEYEAMVAAGWKENWAEHGVETAPAIVVHTVNAPEIPPQASPETYQEVLRLLVSYQAQQDVLSQRVDVLEAHAAAQQAHMEET